MQRLKTISKVVFWSSIVFLFVVFMNFKDIPNKYVVLGAGILWLIHTLLQKKSGISLDVCLLAVAMLCFGKIAGFNQNDVIMTAVYPTVFLLLGKKLVNDNFVNCIKEERLMAPFLAFLFGYSIHGILNCAVYFIYGLPIAGLHYWNDVWTGLRIPATQHSIYVLPLLSMMVPAIIYWKRHKIICSGILLTGIFFIYHAIHVLSRTPILVFGLVACWEVMLLIYFNRDNQKLMRWLRRIILFGCVASVVILLFSWNWLQSHPFIQNLSSDGGILNNIRFRAQRSVIRQMFDYPMGGVDQMYTEGLLYVHNVWLDMAKRTGLIPFFLFTAYTLISVVNVAKLLCSSAGKKLKYTLSGVYIAFILYYTVEPALDANIQYMIPWMFVNGLIGGWNQKTKEKTVEMKSVLTKRQKMYLPVKRVGDVVFSGIAIVLLSPILIAIAIAIKIDSPGPVLFKQKRVGKDKEFFDIWKFRTMRTDTPKDMPTHLLKDPEQYITKTGKLLRKTSLDELPQLFQIFGGKMSICGPRPALWNQDDLIAERDKYGANNIVPGLTGWAQINGRDELEIDVKAKLDGEYVEKFGLVMDIRCFLGTIVSVLKSDGVVEGGTGELNRKK